MPAHASRPENSQISIRNVLLLLTSGVFWGIQPGLIKVSTGGGLSETEALAVVLACVAAIVGSYLVVAGGLFRLTWPRFRFLALVAVLEYVGPLLTAFLVAPHIDSALLTLIMSTTPIFTVPFAAAIGSEPLTRHTVAACLVGLGAMAVLVVPENALPSPDMLPWVLVAFGAPACYALGSVYVARSWPEGFAPTQVAFGGSLGGAILLLPFSFGAIHSGTLAANSAWGHLAFAALALAVVVEMLVYFFLVKHAGAVFASFSSFIMIASGMVLGILLFGESLTPWTMASMLLFAFSLLLVVRASSEKDVATRPGPLVGDRQEVDHAAGRDV